MAITKIKNKRQYRRRSASLRAERLESRRLMTADMVIHWNNHLIDTIRNDTTLPGPTWASRNMAIVQLAVYDAVNAITNTHSSYLTSAKAPLWASKEAAVATAAHDVLVGIYPAQKSQLDNLWTQSLVTISDGPAEDAGIAVGRQVAQEVLASRIDDGSLNQSTYTPSNEPGKWRPDPLNPNQTALGANWGEVSPFAIKDADDYLPPPPPALNSTEYAAAFNEVKSLGEKNSSTRTADQTEIGVFWAYDRGRMGPPMVLYNQNVQQVALLKNNSLAENARLFAMVNLAMADSGIVAWNAKYVYDVGRPITAIREGELDGNPLTIGNANWVQLGAPGGGVVPDFTPPFPAYTSGHATFGAATFKTLANFYGSDHLNFTLTSDELPGVTRSYNRFSDASKENGVSRIYLGIHWNFDNLVGQQQGNQVADYVFANFLKPNVSRSASIGIQQSHGGFATYAMPRGEANLSVHVFGESLRVVNNRTSQIVFETAHDQVNAIRFNAVDGASDILTVDDGYGGTVHVPGGIRYDGLKSEYDRFWYNGTESAETLTLDGNTLHTPGTTVSFVGVSYVGMASQGGDDSLTVKGNQAGRRVDLLGRHGNDTYKLSARNVNVAILESAGQDHLSFETAATAVAIDLSLKDGENQATGSGNTVKLQGDIEDLTGSRFDDRLRGNNLNNVIRGLAGNDYLFGRAGDDRLEGGEGNDVLVGGDGNDWLIDNEGLNVLIGGKGADTFDGGAGENLLIGGSTVFDEQDTALRAILAEWTSTSSKSVRIANLTNGTGSTNRKNGNVFLRTTGRLPTVIDDLTRDLIRCGNAHWVLAGNGDTVFV